MRFVYLLHEWEGSATDSRVLRDLGITTYVTVDIPTLRVFSHPMEDGPNSTGRPTDPYKHFNMRHTRACNII
ncbi:hypothetical protein ACS0TY_020602 [Phlomoides rotata]